MMTAAQENLEAWGGQLWWNEKEKFVLKCILGNFQCFEPMFFLVENWAIQTLPPF